MLFFGLYWLRKEANMPKYTFLKKLCLEYLFKRDEKIESTKKMENVTLCVFENARCDVLGFVISCNFVITFEKIHKA